MSAMNIKVKIKSHPGESIETIKRTCKDGDDVNTAVIKMYSVIVLHVGTNDISDGEDPETVVEKLEYTVMKIKQRCPNLAAIVCSIKPKKRERFVNKIINKTNKRISTMSQQTACHFINNGEEFI